MAEPIDYANRSTPRRRWPWRAIAVLLLLLIYIGVSITNGLWKDGALFLKLNIHATDATTGQPLVNATINVYSVDGVTIIPNWTQSTDAAGMARCGNLTGWGCFHTALYETGDYGSTLPAFTVTLAGFQQQSIAIGVHHYRRLFFWPRPSAMNFEVKLQPMPATQPSDS